jgi:SDR family mycofactocin-dependent oxidoreductase
MGELDGKVAFISGVARGQGRSHALRLAAEGADIIGIDLCGDLPEIPYPLATSDDLAETESLVRSAGRTAILTEVDARDRTGVRSALDRGVQELGRLDIVVANAGVLNWGPTEDITEEQWAEVLGVNLTGAFWTAQAGISHIRRHGEGGSIVFTSSTAGVKGLPFVTPYVAAKHGVLGLMRVMANELGVDNIRVNAVLPTGVRTGMLDNPASIALFDPEHPDGGLEGVGRVLELQNLLPFAFLEPIDVSNAVAFLVSARARYITGLEMRVDGGFLTK